MFLKLAARASRTWRSESSWWVRYAARLRAWRARSTRRSERCSEEGVYAAGSALCREVVDSGYLAGAAVEAQSAASAAD